MFARNTIIGANVPILTTTVAMAKSVHAYPLSKENHENGEVIESPPIKLPNKKHLTPTSIAVVDIILSVRSRTPLKVLFDPGSTSTLISCKNVSLGISNPCHN
jgi:hypothetical protein